MARKRARGSKRRRLLVVVALLGVGIAALDHIARSGAGGGTADVDAGGIGGFIDRAGSSISALSEVSAQLEQASAMSDLLASLASEGTSGAGDIESIVQALGGTVDGGGAVAGEVQGPLPTPGVEAEASGGVDVLAAPIVGSEPILTAIRVGGVHAAVIDGALFRVGDTRDGITLVAVRDRSAVVRRGETEYTLSLP